MKKTKTKETIEKGTGLLQEFIEWLIYVAGYTLVFIIVTSLFHTVHIDSNHLIIWSFIIVLILSVLNKTLKPILVTITMPLTGITFGLFYPFINAFLLKLVDWLLGKHFEIHNIFILFFLAILLSIMNYIVNKIVDKCLKKVKTKKENKHE